MTVVSLGASLPDQLEALALTRKPIVELILHGILNAPTEGSEKMTKTYRWRVAAVVVVGLFMAILDTTIVSVTLPQMQKAFHTDFETITWVASTYFLAQAAVIPIVG